MTIVLDRMQPCRLCGAPLRSCYLNLEQLIYMCSNPKCTFPLMADDLSKFMVSQAPEVANGALDELSQDPFFAEMFGTVSSSTVSNQSRPASRVVTPPYSAVPSISSEGDEEFTNISLIHSAIITTLCINAIEKHLDLLENSVIGSIFGEISKANGTEICNCANKLVEVISQKILFFRPNDNNLSIPIHLNQLMNRLLTDAPAAQSDFKVETSTSANCSMCGFSQTWSSQSSSLQLKSFTGHDNMRQFSSVESCSECGSNSKNVSTSVTKLSDVLAICCHEKASQAMTSTSDLLSPFVDFERTDASETSRYALTTIVKYDEHVRRIVVAVRRDSDAPITDVNNWLRYDSLEAFVFGRSTNPPNVQWLTSLPLLLVWQRVDKTAWRLSDSPRLSALHSIGSSSSMLAQQPPIVNATSKFLNMASQFRSSSRNSSVSGVSTYASVKSSATQKFVLTPPVSTTTPLRPLTALRPKMCLATTPSNSLFLQKSLERLSAHRRCLEGKTVTSSTSSATRRTASQISSSPLTNDSFVSPRSSLGSEAKRSRFDCSGSQDEFDV